MKVPPKPTDYETLRKLWYKKLKKSGFTDIETTSGNIIGYGAFSRARAEWQYGGFEAKAEYHRLADQFLQEHEFESKRERIIWEYHANGISVRDIRDTLKKARVQKMGKDNVWLVIKRLRELMLKKYKVIK